MKLTGYRRKDGSVGIRNHILVLPTVVCANEVARAVAEKVPGAVAVNHQHGCAQLGIDADQTKRTLAGFGANPNVAAVIVVGLGCETELAPPVAREIESRRPGMPVTCLVIQDLGGTDNAIEAGIKAGMEMYRTVSQYKREPIEFGELTVSLECGGSDVTSGIASNPAVGAASDILVKKGATVILSETSELIGAEHILAERAVNEKVKARLLAVVKGMEQALQMGVSITGGNPSPGNIEGGLSTIEEKSLGCVYKGGTSPVMEVIDYAEVPTQKGLVVMDTPGHDIESMTGMAAGGSQICLFTTGRGTPMGSPVMPVIKICGNPKTSKKMSCNIDIDVGTVIEGRETLDEAAERIIKEIVEVVNGKMTAAEQKKMSGFAINRIGPTM